MKLSKERPFFDALIGKTVSDVWRGHGSAIFLEFGELQSVNKHGSSRLDGELTLMIEWSWRIERPRSIVGGSWSDESRWPKMFEAIKDATVSDIQLIGRLPEVCVSLSNGLRVVSFMTSEGQPAWSLISRKLRMGCLSVKHGSLFVEL